MADFDRATREGLFESLKSRGFLSELAENCTKGIRIFHFISLNFLLHFDILIDLIA